MIIFITVPFLINFLWEVSRCDFTSLALVWYDYNTTEKVNPVSTLLDDLRDDTIPYYLSFRKLENFKQDNPDFKTQLIGVRDELMQRIRSSKYINPDPFSKMVEINTIIGHDQDTISFYKDFLKDDYKKARPFWALVSEIFMKCGEVESCSSMLVKEPAILWREIQERDKELRAKKQLRINYINQSGLSKANALLQIVLYRENEKLYFTLAREMVDFFRKAEVSDEQIHKELFHNIPQQFDAIIQEN